MKGLFYMTITPLGLDIRVKLSVSVALVIIQVSSSLNTSSNKLPV
jgi:hypothetical protein